MKPIFEPLTGYEVLPEEQMTLRSREFYGAIKQRRSVRDFSNQPVPRAVIENCLLAAGTAPNGANLQPWHFAVVANQTIKAKVRTAAEAEEKEFYNGKAPAEWLEALEHLGTNENKQFLEIALYLIVIFSKTHDVRPDGSIVKHYYSTESVGIATGMLITALHQCGLATLTHTPSPMKFLNDILERPKNERPFLILVAGYPAADAQVPRITKKPLDEIATFY